LPRFRLAQLLWVLLLVCGFMMVGNDRAEAEEALASWYGPGFDGQQTANGQTFDAGGLTTANRTLPMGTELIVSYGGKSVPVTVNDRGPYTGNRELDLSQGAAQALGLIGAGVDRVDVECANGGIYPNCSATNTPLQNSPPLVQDAPAVQDIPVTQEVPVVQNAPVTQYAPTGQDTSVPQEAPTLQNAPIVHDTPVTQSAPILQDSPVTQYAPIVQDYAGGGVHVVQPGETLSGIATALGTSIDQLMADNGITNPNLIYSGQTLLY
jgi:peptidoglycan lytic transglycosylase